MKTILITIVLLISTQIVHAMPDEMHSVCFEWQGYKVEDDGFKLFKHSLGGVDPDQVDPSYGRKAKVAKVKFENARRKYEKQTGKKFDSKYCNQ